MKIVDEKRPEGRALWSMRAATPEVDRVLREARRLACRREYSALSDAELIKKAFGADEDPREGLYR